MATPLANIRVLDLSRILAGPWAGQLLGDFGADVLKIERPGKGDDTRNWGPPWLEGEGYQVAAYFLSANRNKRSITIDLAIERGRQLVRELVVEADVLLENFRTGAMRRFGLGYDELRAINPRLVYCSISAFGQAGSRAAEPGYDAMIQASAGLMSITGPENGESGGPQKVGVAVADIMAGMYASTAILAALNARELTGEGQCIDVPLYDSQVAWLANQAMNYLIGGESPRRLGTAHPNLVPYQAFSTADGNLMLAVGNDRQFANCVACLGLADLAHDRRFSQNRDRVQNRKALVDVMQTAFRTKGTAEWLRAFKDKGVPAGPINDIGEVLGNAYAAERQLVQTIDNSHGDPVPTVANPVHFAETPVRYGRAAPLLGEHTDEVLREWLGYSDELIAELRNCEAI